MLEQVSSVDGAHKRREIRKGKRGVGIGLGMLVNARNMPDIRRKCQRARSGRVRAWCAISVRLGAAESFDPLVEPKRNPPEVLPRDQSWPMDHVLLVCLARSNSDNSSSILRRGKLFLISGISIFDCCGAILLAADCCMTFPEIEYVGVASEGITANAISQVYGIIKNKHIPK